jgi:thiosulfate reductase cytochrome b subunit
LSPIKQSMRLKKISRLCAWGLLAGVVVLVLSGWGITQTEVIYHATFGLVDRRLANSIHRAVNAPLAVFFFAHVLINLRLNLHPKTAGKNLLIDIILMGVGVLLLAGVVYMEYLR